jgi:hypothetical protein
MPELDSTSGSERLWVCGRSDPKTAAPWLKPSLEYTCDDWLERSDRVLGRDLRSALFGDAGLDGFRFIVRKIAKGANPEHGTDGAVLVEGDDYSSFVVVKDGVALIYIDHSYTAPPDAAVFWPEIQLPTRE